MSRDGVGLREVESKVSPRTKQSGIQHLPRPFIRCRTRLNHLEMTLNKGSEPGSLLRNLFENWSILFCRNRSLLRVTCAYIRRASCPVIIWSTASYCGSVFVNPSQYKMFATLFINAIAKVNAFNFRLIENVFKNSFSIQVRENFSLVALLKIFDHLLRNTVLNSGSDSCY